VSSESSPYKGMDLSHRKRAITTDATQGMNPVYREFDLHPVPHGPPLRLLSDGASKSHLLFFKTPGAGLDP